MVAGCLFVSSRPRVFSPQGYPVHQALEGLKPVFRLLDRLQTRADELYLPEATGFKAPVIRLSPNFAEATRLSKTVPPREGRGGLAVRGYNIAHAIGAFFRL